MTKQELQAELKNRGIKFSQTQNKAELEALLGIPSSATPEGVGAALSASEGVSIDTTTEDAVDALAGADTMVVDVGQKLSEATELEGEDEDSDSPKMKETQGFDLTKLSAEQISQLKTLLDSASPAKAKKKNIIPTVTMRTYEDKVVVDFGRAFPKMVRDPDSQSDKPRTHIKLRVEGSDEWITLLYKEFMNLPRITCKQVSVVAEPDEKEFGEVFSKELKRMVPMMVTYTKRTLTIELPDGRRMTLDSSKVNA